MVLIDTSVWIDHLRRREVKLEELLENDEVVVHPLVRLELALGSIVNREEILRDLSLLPQAVFADKDELFRLVEMRKLYKRGLGVTDLHMIASALFDKPVTIWTRDRRLGEAVEELGVRAGLR